MTHRHVSTFYRWYVLSRSLRDNGFHGPQREKIGVEALRLLQGVDLNADVSAPFIGRQNKSAK